MDALYRTRDTGIGGGADSDGLSEPERALRLLVEFIGAEMTQNINPNKAPGAYRQSCRSQLKQLLGCRAGSVYRH